MPEHSAALNNKRSYYAVVRVTRIVVVIAIIVIMNFLIQRLSGLCGKVAKHESNLSVRGPCHISCYTVTSAHSTH